MQISGARAAAGISDNIQKKTGFRQQSVHSKRQYIEVSKETGLSQGTYTVNGKSFTYNGKYQMIDAEK